jgi:septal ring factor EnvC (AmiA/AmiB activator)
MKKVRIILFFLSIFLLAGVLSAASESGPRWQDLLAGFINSLILFGGLYLILRRGIRRYLDQQSAGIRSNIRDQKKGIRKAEEELKELEKRKDVIEEELTRKQKENDRQVRDQIRQMEAGLEDRITKLHRQIDEEIGDKLEFLLAGMKEEIADAVLERFQKDLKAKMDRPMLERIIRLNIRQIGDNYEA